MKKIFTLLIAFVATSALWADDYAKNYFEIGDFNYRITDKKNKKVEVNNYKYHRNDYFHTVTIPSSVYYRGSTYKVTGIGGQCFSNDRYVTSVIIPNSVTEIGWQAFHLCGDLTSITIPGSVKTIGKEAFSNCYDLASVKFGNGVESIGDEAFRECSSLTSITIPNSVTEIGWWAFRECSMLTSVKIGNGVKGLDGEFSDCHRLKSVTLGKNIEYIGSHTFYNCSSLTSITIPTRVKRICYAAFYNCSSLTSITIPNKVTEIENWAFYGCINLTSITIPSSVTEIADNAFEKCTSLKQINISAPSIQEYCKSPVNKQLYAAGLDMPRKLLIAGEEVKLNDLVIPCTVDSISPDAFKGFDITSVTITANSLEEYYKSSINKLLYAAGVTVPRKLMIAGKEVKLNDLVIPCTVDSISSDAFKGFDITSVSITANSFEEYYKSSINKLLYVAGVTVPRKLMIAGEEVSNLVISSAVHYIADDAFKGCGITSVTITANSFEEYCKSITNEQLFNVGLNVNRELMIDGKLVTEVVVPNGVNSMSKDIFRGCSNITSVIWNAEKYISSENPLESIKNQITSITFGKNVKNIPLNLCNGMSKLEKISLPSGLQSIGNKAFYECKGIKRIKIPNTVTSIGYAAFFGCSSLKSVTIPNSVQSVGELAFSNCTSLKTVRIRDKVGRIGQNAFSECHALEKVRLSDEMINKYRTGVFPYHTQIKSKPLVLGIILFPLLWWLFL